MSLDTRIVVAAWALFALGVLVLVAVVLAFWLTRRKIERAVTAINDHVTAEVGARATEVRIEVVQQAQKLGTTVAGAIGEAMAKPDAVVITPRRRWPWQRPAVE